MPLVLKAGRGAALVGPELADVNAATATYLDDIRAQLAGMTDAEVRDYLKSLDWQEIEQRFGKRVLGAILAEVKRAGPAAVEAIPSGAIDGPDRKRLKEIMSVENPYANARAETRAAELVTSVGDETRQALRLLVTHGLKHQTRPQEIARDLRDFIGPNEPQTRALMSHRDALIEAGAPDVAAQTERYRKRLVRERAQMIAQTELNFAQNIGTLSSWDAAQAEGVMPPSTKKRWIAAWGSERTCPVCGRLHNVEVNVDAQFPGGLDGPPAHPRCRCTVGLVVDLPGVRKPPGKPATEEQLATMDEANAAHNAALAAKRRAWLDRGKGP